MLFSGLTIAQLLSRVIALLIAITIHEFAHAWAASRLGDQTAASMGRLSLNPLKHLDVLGTLMLLTAGIGWGKPVPVNPYNLRNGPKAGMALTSLAGPVSNLLLAAIFSVPLRLGLVSFDAQGASTYFPGAAEILFTVVLMNIGLAVFNLIPLPPLDGYSVALGLLPDPWAAKLASVGRYGPMLLFGLLFLGYLMPIDPLWTIMSPFYNLFLKLFLGI